MLCIRILCVSYHAGYSNAATCDIDEKGLRKAEKEPRAIDRWSTGLRKRGRLSDLLVVSVSSPSRMVPNRWSSNGMMCESFCTTHLPWVVADRSDFRAFLEAVNRSKINFHIPNQQRLSTGVLARMESKWDSAIEKVRSAWDVTGVTIACDEWTDAVGRSIVIVISLDRDACVRLITNNAELDKKTDQSYTHQGTYTQSNTH